MIYRILIVDDETAIKKGLTALIQKSAVDCVVDGVASDGKEAIEFVKKSPPDIVVTDIKMPLCDGLGLAKYLFENHPDVKIIMLTGFADFEYAQAAIQYKVTDLLLKPTSRDKLLAAIEKTKREIAIREAKTNLLKNNAGLLREQHLQTLASEMITDTDASSFFAKELHQFYVLAFQIISGAEALSGSKQLLKNIVEQQSGNEYVYRLDNIVCCAYHCDEGNLDTIIQFSSEMISLFKQLYGLNVIVGISKEHEGIPSLSGATREAKQALSLAFFSEQTVLCYKDQDREQFNAGTFEPWQHLHNIEMLIQAWKFEEATANVESLFNDVESKHVSKDDVKYICGQIYYILSSALRRKQLPPLEKSYLTRLSACHTAPNLKSAVLSMICETSNRITVTNRPMNQLVKKSMLFVHEHLTDDISLETIATAVNTNPSYLSRIFKKECGETLSEYITRLRIEKAKELLVLPDQLVYLVSESVGYHDSTYFSTIFKKYTGMSPTEYRNRFYR